MMVKKMSESHLTFIFIHRHSQFLLEQSRPSRHHEFPQFVRVSCEQNNSYHVMTYCNVVHSKSVHINPFFVPANIFTLIAESVSSSFVILEKEILAGKNMKYTVCLSCIIWNLKPKHSPSVMTCLLTSSYSVWIIRTHCLYRSQEGCVSKLFSSDRKAQTMPSMRCNRASLMQTKIQQFGTMEASLTLNIGKHTLLTYRLWIGLRFMPLRSS